MVSVSLLVSLVTACGNAPARYNSSVKGASLDVQALKKICVAEQYEDFRGKLEELDEKAYSLAKSTDCAEGTVIRVIVEDEIKCIDELDQSPQGSNNDEGCPNCGLG